MTPEACAARIGEWGPALTQLTGRLRASAIIALADETVTAAAMGETNPTGEFRPELFPLTLHMSANLIGKTNRGSLVAEVALVVATFPAPAAPAMIMRADRPGR